MLVKLSDGSFVRLDQITFIAGDKTYCCSGGETLPIPRSQVAEIYDHLAALFAAGRQPTGQ